jgi:hypothetical protein
VAEFSLLSKITSTDPLGVMMKPLLVVPLSQDLTNEETST